MPHLMFVITLHPRFFATGDQHHAEDQFHSYTEWCWGWKMISYQVIETGWMFSAKKCYFGILWDSWCPPKPLVSPPKWSKKALICVNSGSRWISERSDINGVKEPHLKIMAFLCQILLSWAQMLVDCKSSQSIFWYFGYRPSNLFHEIQENSIQPPRTRNRRRQHFVLLARALQILQECEGMRDDRIEELIRRIKMLRACSTHVNYILY